MKINVVSDSRNTSGRSEPLRSNVAWSYSLEPEEADWHVVMGVRRAISVPNRPERVFFILTEPPEVVKYDVQVLRQYGEVIGARFDYLSSLRNHREAGGVLPWRIGLLSRRKDATKSSDLSLAQLGGLQPPPFSHKLTMLVSDKANTAYQVARLRLRDYLARKMPELEVFGSSRMNNRVGDSLEVFSRAPFHIAIENSRHKSYWTEKLSDPVIGWNHVAYGGHPSSLLEIPGRSNIHINPFFPAQAYRRIANWMSGISDALSSEESRGIARNYILENSGFHNEVLSAIAAVSKLQVPTSSEILDLPPHRISSNAHPPAAQVYKKLCGKG